MSESPRWKTVRLQEDETEVQQVRYFWKERKKERKKEERRGGMHVLVKCACHNNVLLCSSMTQVNNLREIQALRRLNPHPNVIELKEVIL